MLFDSQRFVPSKLMYESSLTAIVKLWLTMNTIIWAIITEIDSKALHKADYLISINSSRFVLVASKHIAYRGSFEWNQNNYNYLKHEC